MPSQNDPTQAIREKASSYPNVDEGTACTQSSFKVGGKAFLFIGEQGGRYKAMFKLQDSIAQAEQLASKEPDNYQVGSWTTARFTAEKPIPKRVWQKWLNESYALASSRSAKKKSAKKTSTKKKLAGEAKRVKKKSAKKKSAAKKKSTSK